MFHAHFTRSKALDCKRTQPKMVIPKPGPPISQEKQEWILELSFGNAGPSSQAHLYKSMPRLAFKSMSLWMNDGVQKVENRLRAIGYQPTKLKGSPTKRCWCLSLRKRALTFPNPNPRNANGVQPSAFGGSMHQARHEFVFFGLAIS